MKLVLKTGLTLGVLFVAGWLSSHWWAPALSEWLHVGQPLQRVDVLLALPGDQERRPFVAAALTKAGMSDKLVIVTTAPTLDVVDGVHTPEHVVTQRIYAARGIEEDRVIVLRGASTSTADDASQLATYLAANPNLTAGVVTNAYHTRRTRWTLDRRFPDLARRVHVFAAPDPYFVSDHWWKHPEGFRVISSEYLKLIVYVARYLPSWMFAVVGVTGLIAVAAWYRLVVSPRKPHLDPRAERHC